MARERPITFIKRHCVRKGKKLLLEEAVADEIMAVKMPFTDKQYYAFCDKHLDDDAEEDLYLDTVNLYFREIATDYDTLKYFFFLKQFYTKGVFCDIGCGIGNTLHFVKKMGYETFGYEINTELQPIHKKIKADIVYGDITELNLSRLSTVDVIYLYRPMNDTKAMNELFRKIHAKTKKGVLVFYNFPHSRTIEGFDTITLNLYDDHIILLTKKTGTK